MCREVFANATLGSCFVGAGWPKQPPAAHLILLRSAWFRCWPYLSQQRYLSFDRYILEYGYLSNLWRDISCVASSFSCFVNLRFDRSWSHDLMPYVDIMLCHLVVLVLGAKLERCKFSEVIRYSILFYMIICNNVEIMDKYL